MDLFPGQDIYEGSCNYMATLLEGFNRLADEYNFEIVDASSDAETLCEHLKKKILKIVEPVQVESPAGKLSEALVEPAVDRHRRLFLPLVVVSENGVSGG
ncbi:MAG TPA: hypothetical protein VGT24_11595 [Candidatus Acidoferrales bacterium]|nr:hypothetical protein [Candidatus Acidoferrales bacterium]